MPQLTNFRSTFEISFYKNNSSNHRHFDFSTYFRTILCKVLQCQRGKSGACETAVVERSQCSTKFLKSAIANVIISYLLQHLKSTFIFDIFTSFKKHNRYKNSSFFPFYLLTVTLWNKNQGTLHKWFTRKANHQNNHEGRRINNKNSRKIIFEKFPRRNISDIKNLKKD